jgi:hypothetical protein
MSTAPDGWGRWLGMTPKRVPDYNNFQQIIGTAVYVGIVALVIGIIIFIILRRR